MLVCPHSGIGNQIGNYVFGQFLLHCALAECSAASYNTTAQNAGLKFLFLDDENIDRTFVLNKFNTELTEASKEDIERFLKARANFTLYKFLIKNIHSRKREYFNSFYKMLQRIRLKYNIYPVKTPALMSKVVSYKNVLENISKNNSKTAIKENLIENIIVCDCYSPIKEFYEPSFREKMKKHFVLKEKIDEKNKEILEKIRNCKNSVGIHIRRGDYLGLKIPVVKKEFLLKKINFFNEKFGNSSIDSTYGTTQNGVKFFIFSDGMDWAKEHIQGQNVNFVDINDEDHGYLDFVLLNNCRHRIYSASSFSKWVQYLNPYEDSIEFMPESKDAVVE